MFCTSLTSITIPDGVTIIGNSAFRDCRSLAFIEMPSGITSIKEGAFAGCGALTSVELPETITEIEGFTFSDCAALTSIVLPDKITSIGPRTFNNCGALQSIEIPENVKTISREAFSDCAALTSIVIPKKVTSIENWAFSDCKSLEFVVVPASVAYIADNAFVGCKKLTVYGETGSYAEKYAKENNIKFISGKPPIPVFTAVPTPSKIFVNNEETVFDAYNIGGSNYFKLRDLAYALNGTQKQFEVGWDAEKNAISLESGIPYTKTGSEMSAKSTESSCAVPTTSKIYLNGKQINLAAYNIDGSNYFKLRDIGQAFDFGVIWDSSSETISIETDKSYTPKKKKKTNIK
jgi:hypothetical protein